MFSSQLVFCQHPLEHGLVGFGILCCCSG